MKYQPLTTTIQIKSIIDVYERLYFTKVGKVKIHYPYTNYSLTNCISNFCRTNAKVKNYTAIVELDWFSSN
jgi:hypothetical protein